MFTRGTLMFVILALLFFKVRAMRTSLEGLVNKSDWARVNSRLEADIDSLDFEYVLKILSKVNNDSENCALYYKRHFLQNVALKEWSEVKSLLEQNFDNIGLKFAAVVLDRIRVEITKESNSLLFISDFLNAAVEALKLNISIIVSALRNVDKGMIESENGLYAKLSLLSSINENQWDLISANFEILKKLISPKFLIDMLVYARPKMAMSQCNAAKDLIKKLVEWKFAVDFQNKNWGKIKANLDDTVRNLGFAFVAKVLCPNGNCSSEYLKKRLQFLDIVENNDWSRLQPICLEYIIQELGLDFVVDKMSEMEKKDWSSVNDLIKDDHKARELDLNLVVSILERCDINKDSELYKNYLKCVADLEFNINLRKLNWDNIYHNFHETYIFYLGVDYVTTRLAYFEPNIKQNHSNLYVLYLTEKNLWKYVTAKDWISLDSLIINLNTGIIFKCVLNNLAKYEDIIQNEHEILYNRLQFIKNLDNKKWDQINDGLDKFIDMFGAPFVANILSGVRNCITNEGLIKRYKELLFQQEILKW
ncbi:hypothetical protein ROZALSC1DRAFT_25239, partial [Rozella allomycis CSF55]